MNIHEILPKEGVMLFEDVKSSFINKGYSNAVSEEAAWKAVKSKLVNSSSGFFAMSESFKPVKFYTFEMKDSQTKVVMNANTEEILLEAVLASTEPNSEGYFFTDEELELITKQINESGSTLPDVDHELLKELVKVYGRNDELIRQKIASRKGVFKSIKSLVKDGKLWIQASLDKRYKNHVDKFNSLSIEAFADSDESKRLRNPKYLGFTFTNNPKLKSAKIVK